MNRIQELFSRKDRDVLNIYFTAGYPNLQDTGKVVLALEKAGVDLIEIGMPYSDPMADGPTIQQSSQAALQNGMTLPLLFKQIREVREQTRIPLVLMGYFNQVMQFGEEAFLTRCQEAGVDGLILPDLPIHEFETYFRDLLLKTSLSVSFLITPQTSEERIRKIDRLSNGFVYMVSSDSITGARSEISEPQVAYFERINAMQLRNPRLIGFGISNHETFSTACRYAHGAIIGSAYIRALAAGDDVERTTTGFVRMVRGA